MFDNQVQRVKDNILPFVLIGLFVGIFIGKASWFRSFGWINDYLKYAEINTYYPDSGQILFFNHFGPDSLTFLLVAIFAFAGIGRMARGVREKDLDDKDGIVQSLENLGSLLAVAWLGLILGMTPPVLIYEGFASSVGFLVNIAYPLVFLVEVNICIAFLSGDTLRKVHDLVERYDRSNFGVRGEGLFLLALAILILTYENKHVDTITAFTLWIRSFL
jgi:hypothetical protein